MVDPVDGGEMSSNDEAAGSNPVGGAVADQGERRSSERMFGPRPARIQHRSNILHINVGFRAVRSELSRLELDDTQGDDCVIFAQASSTDTGRLDTVRLFLDRSRPKRFAKPPSIDKRRVVTSCPASMSGSGGARRG